MNFRILATVLLVGSCLSAAGCRRDAYTDAYFDMLNVEKRVLEDRLYELEYQYEQAVKELDSCRETEAPTKSSPETSRSDDDLPDAIEGLPEIELPPGFDPTGGSDSAMDSGRDPPRPPRSVLVSRSGPGRSRSTTSDRGGRVDHIYINPRVTGGEDFDHQPGDDGLAVLIEPRDEDAHFVASSGAVSIVVVDPAEVGPAARVARWDFDARVAAKVLQSDSLDRGLLFRVPWSHVKPKHAKLRLFVRFTTADGRKLEAERELSVDPPSLVAQQWTPRPAEQSSSSVDGVMRASFEDGSSATRPITVRADAPAEDSPKELSREAGRPAASGIGPLWKPTR